MGAEYIEPAKPEQAAWDRGHRPKICKLVENRALARIVAKKLERRWSPEQIAGWLKKTYPEDESYQVSHEIIYRSLYVQARGALKKELIKHLRTQRTMRRSRHGNRSGEGQGQIKGMVRISERPASVEDRAVPGHWEGDLIAGPNESYIATLVERHTRYVMLAKVDGKDTKNGHRRANKTVEETAPRTVSVTYMGSRKRALRSQTL